MMKDRLQQDVREAYTGTPARTRLSPEPPELQQPQGSIQDDTAHETQLESQITTDLLGNGSSEPRLLYRRDQYTQRQGRRGDGC